MRRVIDESSQLESNTIGVFRSAATVKGGRRFSFGSMVVVGDRAGKVGLGYAKANEVPPAIEKAQKAAKKGVKTIHLQGGTIPHAVTGRYGAAKIRILPASPGTGVVAGSTVRAVLELAGITDCMTKSYGSNNSKNVAKAVMNGLEQLRPKEYFGELRGVEIGETEVDVRLKRGEAFLVKPTKQDEDTEGAGSDASQAGAPKGADKASEGPNKEARTPEGASEEGGSAAKPEATAKETDAKKGEGEQAG